MYTALYRTYRPETFQEILGQEHIVKILKKLLDFMNIYPSISYCDILNKESEVYHEGTERQSSVLGQRTD